MIDFPRLSWLNGKQYKQSFATRKNESGHQQEHVDAIVEDRIRSSVFANPDAYAKTADGDIHVQDIVNEVDVLITAAELEKRKVADVQESQ